jgi:hypothetical protein
MRGFAAHAGNLRSLDCRQVTLVEQLEEAVLLLDMQHHNAIDPHAEFAH